MTDLMLVPALLVHFMLIAAPLVAGCLLVAWLGVRNPVTILAAGLGASGVLATLVFWCYYADPGIGRVTSFLVVAVAVGVIAFTCISGRITRSILHTIVLPVTLWGLGSAFVLFFGFLHGGSTTSVATAAERFFPGQMATDNDLPQFFAAWFYLHGHSGIPPVYPGDWLASDRPPLQLGYVDAQRPFGWDGDGLDYQIVGVLVQQLWIVGMWILLLAAGVGRRCRALVLLACLASGFVLVNGFYVWPKLLPAAMLLAATALVLPHLRTRTRSDVRTGVLFACLLALSMLGHGGSLFALIPVVIAVLVGGVPRPRWIIAVVLTGIVLYAPWMAYQKYGDPPGNRLSRWSLAGDVRTSFPPGFTVTRDIGHAYRHVGLGGAIHNKLENGITTIGGGPMVDELLGAASGIQHDNPKETAFDLRLIAFSGLFPQLGLYLLAPLLLLGLRRRLRPESPEFRLARDALRLTLVGTLIWCLILFGNLYSRAAILEGSYLFPLLLITSAVAGMDAVSPRATRAVTVVAVLSTLALYAPSFTPPPGTSYEPFAAVLAALSLLGFAGVCGLEDGFRFRGLHTSAARPRHRVTGFIRILR